MTTACTTPVATSISRGVRFGLAVPGRSISRATLRAIMPRCTATSSARYKKLIAEIDALRPRLHDLVIAANAAGFMHVDIANASGYTRDRVYKIVKGQS